MLQAAEARVLAPKIYSLAGIRSRDMEKSIVENIRLELIHPELVRIGVAKDNSETHAPTRHLRRAPSPS
jgi:hypothetical protein